jgi:cyclic pyranopterin phosphate synthase
MPVLADRFSRPITYLRVSVTDRCNFRCVYCMPAEGVRTIPRADVLTFEEIARVVRVGVSLGLRKVRLTGGEPTVRADLPVLVRMLRAIDGLGEISMTTNAARLTELAGPLRAAGLGRVNVSLDTLDRDRAARLARRDALPQVLAGIDAAVAAGLTPLKLNAGRGPRRERPRAARPRRVRPRPRCRDAVHRVHADGRRPARRAGPDRDGRRDAPAGSARPTTWSATSAAPMPAAPVPATPRWPHRRGGHHRRPTRPGSRVGVPRTGARVGFITSVSDHFCDACNRMRLTAEGALRPCLHQDAEVDVRSVLRAGGPDEQVADAFRHAAGLKWRATG